MTLKKYLQILGKRIWIFIVTIIVILLATFIFTSTAEDTYSGSLSIYTIVTQQQIPKDQGTFYEYDNYYAFKSSEIFADTVITWLKDPSNVAEIYSKANEALPDISLKKYSKLITAKKNEPATVQISLQSDNEEFVNKLIDSTKYFIEDKVEDWQQKGLLDNTEIEISNPIVIMEKPDMLTNIAIALIISIVLGLALVYLTEYMQTKN